MCAGCYSVDKTITAEEKDSQIKPTAVVERLEATPGEQTGTKSPSLQLSSSDIHVLTIAAEAGDSARDVLASIRSKRGRHAVFCYKDDFALTSDLHLSNTHDDAKILPNVSRWTLVTI